MFENFVKGHGFSLRQLLQRYGSECHAILPSKLLRPLDPFRHLEFLEPGIGSAQMRCGGVVVPLGMGERRQVEMRPCQVVSRRHGIKGGKGLLEIRCCGGESPRSCARSVRACLGRDLCPTDG